MKTDSIIEPGTEDKVAPLKAKIEEMKQRRIAVAQPLRARYAALREELALVEKEIRVLDEDWESPK
jgi:hypothetical protein